MNRMIGSTTDKKNIGLLANLWRLRQTLDVYCLIAANADAIEKKGQGKKFFRFLRTACLYLIATDICKIFEREKKGRSLLNSVDGVLTALGGTKLAGLDSTSVNSFVSEYNPSGCKDGTLCAISRTVEHFRTTHEGELKCFKTFRDKWCAHSEFGFEPCDLPSYEVMERLFSFGRNFYALVSRVFVSVGPLDLNREREVKVSLKKVLLDHGLAAVKTEMG